jgi:hypothetical protein
MAFAGSYESVKRYMAKLRKADSPLAHRIEVQSEGLWNRFNFRLEQNYVRRFPCDVAGAAHGNPPKTSTWTLRPQRWPNAR